VWTWGASVKLNVNGEGRRLRGKLNPATLDAVLRQIAAADRSNVLVGFDTNDDAGIYLLAKGSALVQTVDFFTPIVDDPQLFGQIAAANALGDVYAMGGRPVSALSTSVSEKGRSRPSSRKLFVAAC